jgi:hypothetical protein
VGRPSKRYSAVSCRVQYTGAFVLRMVFVCL